MCTHKTNGIVALLSSRNLCIYMFVALMLRNVFRHSSFILLTIQYLKGSSHLNDSEYKFSMWWCLPGIVHILPDTCVQV